MSKIYALLLVGCTFGLHASDKELTGRLEKLGVLSPYSDYCRYTVKVSEDAASVEVVFTISSGCENRRLEVQKSVNKNTYDQICGFFNFLEKKPSVEQGVSTKKGIWFDEDEYSD